MKLKSGSGPGLQISEGFPRAGGSSSNMVHLYSRWMVLGVGWRPLHRFSAYTMAWWMAFSRASDKKSMKQKSHISFISSFGSHTASLPSYPVGDMGGVTQGVNTKR